MEKRYEEILLKLEAEKGIYFEIPKETNNKLVIKARIDHKAYCMENCSNNPTKFTETDDFTFLRTDISSSKNYANPPIPPGYRYVHGNWNTGFVIERQKDESQFVWVPVGFLEPNGTIDNVSFDQQFGRRDFRQKDYYGSSRDLGFGKSECDEDLSLGLQKSIKKYGGFFISRFNISHNSKTGKYESKRGRLPCSLTFSDASYSATFFESSSKVCSHLPYGAEYDSILEWFIESKQKTPNEIIYDSSSFGNVRNSYRNENGNHVLLPTGSSEYFCVNEIYDLAGNVTEWTQETYDFQKHSPYSYIHRGGSYMDITPVAHKNRCDTDATRLNKTGFRIALYL